jgi:tripartite-type tricarboxylate transporter receptor subunit TctC
MTSSNRVTRRAVLAAGVSALLLAHASGQAAWPNRPIKLIVPFAPGGSNDNIARVLAIQLGARLGQSIVVENKGGSGGTIGTDSVAKSPPDGYTLLFASTSITTNVASGKKLPYDPSKDLEPIGEVGAGPFVVVVSNDLKVTTLGEFIALARAKPKSINYGSAGVGGINHLGTELLASEAKVQLVHVPYRGIGPAFTDLIAGNLQMLLPTLASVTQYIQAGTMRGLAVTGAQRSPLAPELPTVAEAGLPGFRLEAWWGLLGPARLPAALIKRLGEELNATLALPDVREALAREGATPQPGTPEDLRNLIGSELVRWSRLIKDAQLQID